MIGFMKGFTPSSDKMIMKFRSFRLAACLVLAACTSPPPAPVVPPPVPVPVSHGPDDDHQSVSREEFQASPWGRLPQVATWKFLPAGAAAILTDGREVRLEFVAPSVIRWWVPAAPGESPLSPGAVYGEPGIQVTGRQTNGVLFLDTPDLGLRWNLSDLSWTLVRGEKELLHTAGGARVSGRRLDQAFAAADATRWFGPGLEAESQSAKHWIDDSARPDGTGPFSAPVLVGAGGSLPLVLALDNSYQSYSRVTAEEASLGAVNGGLDLLVSAAPRADDAVGALTGLTGRLEVPPSWAFGTALVLPPEENGLFLRGAKLPIQTAVGAYRGDRPFRSLVPGPGPLPLPDLTAADVRAHWLSLPPFDSLPTGGGVVLQAVPGRQDWTARFNDGGRNSPLAGMHNRLVGVSTKAVAEAWSLDNPGLRPFVLTESAVVGSLRWALPEIRVKAGEDSGGLAQVLNLGMAGLGTPAIRLDLSPLGRADRKEAAFQSLLSWMLIPVLTLDWGDDPAGFWAGLAVADQKRLKAILDCRSQFRPLFSQITRTAAMTGRAAWTPIWFGAPTDPKALSQDGEFLFGEGLLAAPVQAGSNHRSVYLPGPGVWFDFWSGTEFGSGQVYDIEAKSDRPLLFVRGGAMVPLREPEAFDGKAVYNPLTVHVFPGGRGMGTYYFDDGISLAWKTGAAWETRLVFDFSQREMTLDHGTVATTGSFRADPYLLYRIHSVYRPKQVKIDGKVIPLFGDSWGVTDTDRSAAWYESDHSLLLKTFRPERAQTIQILF